MKYIVFTDKKFILFDESVSHCDRRLMGKTPMSAGFYGNGMTYGASMSLSLGSNPDDIKYIEYTHACIKCSDKMKLPNKEDLFEDYGWIETNEGCICHECAYHR